MSQIAAALFMFMSFPADACEQRPTTLSAGLADAALVFRARVEAISYTTDPNEQEPLTHWRLEVLEEFRGHVTSGQVYLRVPGGPIPDGWVTYVGAPTGIVGEEIVLFAFTIGNDTVGAKGWSHGIWIADASGYTMLGTREPMGNPLRCDGPVSFALGAPVTDDAVARSAPPPEVTWYDALSVLRSCASNSQPQAVSDSGIAAMTSDTGFSVAATSGDTIPGIVE